jgi:hypothetical protein
MVGFAAALLHRPKGRTPQPVALSGQTHVSAAEQRRLTELESGLKRYAQVLREARAFEAWIRDVRPKILAGQARSSFPRVECQGNRQGGRPPATCSVVHFPYGGPSSIRYELSWYRDRPGDMRAVASALPYSPLLNCEALALRQKRRFTEEDGSATTLHCEIPESTESYAVRSSLRAGAQDTTLSWFSAYYLTRDNAARRSLQLDAP